MSKQEFLKALRKGLKGMPKEDIEERLTFYDEMIDDFMEEGATEEAAAVARLGSVESVISQIRQEIPPAGRVKEKEKRRKFNAWEIVLLILGSPLWLSLLITLFAVVITVVLAIYVVLWSIVVAFWAIELALAVCLPAGVFLCVLFSLKGNFYAGLAMLGAGLVCAGIAIFGYFGCKQASKGALVLTKMIFRGIKSLFIRRRGRNEKEN